MLRTMGQNSRGEDFVTPKRIEFAPRGESSEQPGLLSIPAWTESNRRLAGHMGRRVFENGAL